MRIDRLVFLIGVVLSLGCQRKVMVFADPWLEGYSREVVQAFESENPDIQVELKIISSEVAASHLRFGQPIDVLLCFDPEVLEKVGVKDKLDTKFVLASERMAFVEAMDQGKFERFGTTGCMAIEASQRPGRLLSDEFMKQHPEISAPKCMIVADFQKQMVDYLLRGWVPSGIVPSALTRRKPETLRVKSYGNVVPDAYSAYLTRIAAQNPDAGTFFNFLKGKKSLEILAQEGLIP